MERSEDGCSALTDATAAKRAMQVAAWRQLWRLLLQPTGDEPEQCEAAPDQEAATVETHDDSVPSPTEG
jgi:hypothetical protein